MFSPKFSQRGRLVIACLLCGRARAQVFSPEGVTHNSSSSNNKNLVAATQQQQQTCQNYLQRGSRNSSYASSVPWSTTSSAGWDLLPELFQSWQKGSENPVRKDATLLIGPAEVNSPLLLKGTLSFAECKQCNHRRHPSSGNNTAQQKATRKVKTGSPPTRKFLSLYSKVRAGRGSTISNQDVCPQHRRKKGVGAGWSAWFLGGCRCRFRPDEPG